jgi:hypothetical protein
MEGSEMKKKRIGNTRIVRMAVSSLGAAHHGLGAGDASPKRSPPQRNSAQESRKMEVKRRFDGIKKGKGDKIMKHIGTRLSMLVLAGSLAGSAIAADEGVLVKEKFSGDYCHMKFPAIRPSTLWTDHPQLKSAQTGDVIDFYGSCDESPTGQDQVQAQRLAEQHAWTNNYESD